MATGCPLRQYPQDRHYDDRTQAVHEGKLSLDQPVTIQAKYQNNDSGCFQHLRPGFTFQLRDVLVMMIIVSDNTCTGTVVDIVGLEH